MSEKTLSSNLLAKLAIAFAAIVVAFAMATAPGQAYAAAGSSTEPDNIISVNGTNVDLDAVYGSLTSAQLATHTTLGGLFVQNGVVKVVKTDKYVKLSELMNYLNESWASGDTMTFDVWGTVKDNNGNVTGWTPPAQYTKFTAFTYDNLMTTYTDFCQASATAIDTSTVLSTSEAVIALKSTTEVIPSGSSASAVLSSSSYPTVGYTTGSYTYDTPRLVWGCSSSSDMGKRFPSNIDAITIS